MVIIFPDLAGLLKDRYVGVWEVLMYDSNGRYMHQDRQLLISIQRSY